MELTHELEVTIGILIAVILVIAFGRWYYKKGVKLSKSEGVYLSKGDLVVYKGKYHEVLNTLSGNKYNLKCLDRYKTLELKVDRKEIERKID